MRRRILLSDGSMPPDQYEYVDLGLPSGLKWCKTDVGAFNEGDYGLYFSWGGTVGYPDASSGKAFTWADYELCGGSDSTLTKYNNNSSYGTVDNKTVLEAVDDAATVNMGSRWRMPTYDEYRELMNNTNYEWVTNYKSTGHNVMKLTSKTDSSKYIIFPASGLCSSGSVSDVGSYGNFWSSSLGPSGARYGRSFYVYSSGRGTNSFSRCYGRAVRGVLAS